MRTMRKQGGVKVSEVADELAALAGKCGLVANTDEGRQAFGAWLANDHRAARKALFGRVAAQRAAATKATAPSKKYPMGWLRASGVRAGAAKASAAQNYPTGWLRAAGVRAGGQRARITQAGD
jgi:hypothetical protein